MYENIEEVKDAELEVTLRQHATYAACASNKVFSQKQEEALVHYLKKCNDHYCGLSVLELRDLAYQFALQLRVNIPPTWSENKMSGREWYYGFMQRHPTLILRSPEQNSINRVKSFSPENVKAFFNHFMNA